ncbi:hypothetical protein NMG60_11001910 [Bertholletia excelsa]
MLSQASTSSSGLLSYSFSRSRKSRKINSAFAYCRLLKRKAENCYSTTPACVSVGIDEIAEIARNKVLIAAAVSAATGQVSKPFTSAFLHGKKINFDLKAACQAGGFPSTHSSAAVATAMSLGLERGFSDAVFGLAVVYAGLVLYDAQGVRREVGIHAKVLNRIQLENLALSNEVDELVDSQPSKSSSDSENYEALFLEEYKQDFYNAKQKNANLLLRSEKRKEQNGMLISPGSGPDIEDNWSLFKESVGHNEIEVIAGALLGLFVSLAVYTLT